MSVADLRREYNVTGLRRTDLESDPIAQFKKWFEQAAGMRRSGLVRKFLIRCYKSLLMVNGPVAMEVNAATLATAGRDGRPSARIVLLKGMDRRGFIFFTNYESRKGREIAENPNVAMVFYWSDQERQVCIGGKAERIPREESEVYFKSRPKGSRLAAWASHQSEPVESRDVLEARWKELTLKYPGEDIPMPESWGGYVLCPVTIEFWQGRPSRLHDRFRYSQEGDNNWRIERLSP